MKSESRVDVLLERVEVLLRDEVAASDDVAKQSLAALLSTGRRIRARIVIETAVAHSGASNDERIAAGAAAIELVHVASLIHDDLMDSSAQRRGTPALHVVHGSSRAILLGNLLTMRGLQLADRVGPAAAGTLLTAVEKVNRGQLLESELSATDEDGFLSYIALKTAALVEAAARLGSIAADLDAAATDEMAAFGWNFGMMFQMVDDICDFAGSEQALGKPVHQDLGNQVYSLPIQNAFAQDPTLDEYAARAGMEPAYARMIELVDMDLIMRRWRKHAAAAQTHLEAAMAGVTASWLAQLPARYSVDVLLANGVVSAGGQR